MKKPRWRWRVASIGAIGEDAPEIGAGGAFSEACSSGGGGGLVSGSTHCRCTQIRSPLHSMSLPQPSSARAATAKAVNPHKVQKIVFISAPFPCTPRLHDDPSLREIIAAADMERPRRILLARLDLEIHQFLLAI